MKKSFIIICTLLTIISPSIVMAETPAECEERVRMEYASQGFGRSSALDYAIENCYSQSSYAPIETSTIYFPTTNGTNLSCFNIDGASIFGFDGDNYIYIGSIANEYNSDSIANEYGTYGNEYNSKSIFNEYGDFGNKYSSYSATNEYSNKPPVLIDKNFEVLGYLTMNKYLSPTINIWEALLCAQDSYAYPIDRHEDFIFSELPESANTYYYLPSSTYDLSCPDETNGYRAIDGNCYCNDGYYWDGGINKCAKLSCPANSYEAVDGNCYCKNGYFWSESSNSCEDLEKTCTEVFGAYSEVKNDQCGCKDGYNVDPKTLKCTKEEAFFESNNDLLPSSTTPIPSNTNNDLTPIFDDITTSSQYYEAIKFVKDNNIVQGYEDGTYKPEKQINRAEFTKILSEARFNNEISVTNEGNCFTDIVIGTWYSRYICFSKENGLVDGYPDGSFGPGQDINVMEALKISLEAFYTEIPDAEGEWYEKYWQFAETEELTLQSWQEPGHKLTRGEMAELIYRIKK